MSDPASDPVSDSGARPHGPVRYRVMMSKADVRVAGPEGDEAVAEITAPFAQVNAEEFDAAVEFMRGTVSATGHIGAVLEVLGSGEATRTLRSLL